MLHPVLTSYIQSQLGAGYIYGAIGPGCKEQIGNMLKSRRGRFRISRLIGDQNDAVIALCSANEPLHIGLYMNTKAVRNDLCIDLPVVAYSLVYAYTTALRILDNGSGGIGMMGADTKTIGHQGFNLLRCGF